MGNNYRGGFQCLDLSKYNPKYNTSITKEEFEEYWVLCNNILKNSTKSLCVIFKHITMYNCSIQLLSNLDESTRYIFVYDDKGNEIAYISFDELYCIVSDKYQIVSMTITNNDSGDVLSGKFRLLINNDVKQSLTNVFEEVDDGSDIQTIMQNIIGIDNGFYKTSDGGYCVVCSFDLVYQDSIILHVASKDDNSLVQITYNTTEDTSTAFSISLNYL